MPHNSIFTRIKDLIGDEVANIVGYKDLINSGFNYAADLIPLDSELWRTANLVSSENLSSPDAADAKVVLVVRTDSDGIERVCKEVPFDYLRKGEDTSSIYYNARNYKNPIYSYDANGNMVVRPDSGGSVKIYRFHYLSDTDLTGDSIQNGSTFRFPNTAIQLGILKACSYLLQAKISEAVQEEEDNELLALLQGQMSTIDKLIQEELQRLGFPFQLVGDGNDVE